MTRKKGKCRQYWTPKKDRKPAKLDEDDAGEMKTEAGSSSAVAELPPDVWVDIISRLPFKQVLLCRCICRAWNAFLARIHYHHPNPNPNPTTPATLLYFSQSMRGTWSYARHPRNYITLAELRDGASYASTVTRVKDGYTCLGRPDDDFLWPVASCDGLVCFVRKIDRYLDKDVFVGNPLLKERLLRVRPSKFTMKTKASQWSEVVGFGFSPRADRYKIVKFTWFHDEPDQDQDQGQDHFLICTVGEGSSRGKRKRIVCSPSWRRLLSFPRYFHGCSSPPPPVMQLFQQVWLGHQPGSHLHAGIHWLVSDKEDDSVFISRLDLDTEQFGRIEAPQSPDFNATHLRDLSLGVSDGHLIICANLNLHGQYIIDIWVMNLFNLWTKNLVVRSPTPANCPERVEVLNYGKVEAAVRKGAVAEVMILVRRSRLYACTTRGRHIRQLHRPRDGDGAIVHIPSFLSINDVIAKL